MLFFNHLLFDLCSFFSFDIISEVSVTICVSNCNVNILQIFDHLPQSISLNALARAY